MNPRQTAAVAPVNWKTSQMLGMKFAPKKRRVISVTVISENLKLSRSNGRADGKRRPSKLTLNG